MILEFQKSGRVIYKRKKEKINMKEKWKIIEEFPKYLISNEGRIKILITLEDKKVLVKDDRYIATTLGNGKQSYKYDHRLVDETYVNKKYDKTQGNQINGVKGKNRAENLEWRTTKLNISDAIDTGLFIYRKKEENN